MEALRELKIKTSALESRVKHLQLQGLELDDQLRQARPPMDFSKLEWRRTLPNQTERIWKDECALSFATPYSPGGLFINLKTLTAFSLRYVEQDWKKTGPNCVYLRQQWTFIPDDNVDTELGIHPEIKKLAIGVEGGFQVEGEKGHVKKTFSICIGPKFLDDYAIESSPSDLRKLIDFVINKDDASRQMDVMAWEAANELYISRYAMELEQVENGIKISSDPKSWKCADSGITENLWLNLSTGYIGSGRANWDGTGGTGAALRHYQDTGGKYPLVVKLGTITPDGKADVYSYAPDEDCMVIDPLLPKHLSHWGINVGEMRKTEKTIAELEVELNVKHDWSRISEEGKTLEKVAGPMCVGLVNLGNSCYCNSVYQSLMSSRSFLEGLRLADAAHVTPNQPQFDLLCQFYKLEEAFSNPELNVRPLSSKPFSGSDYVSPRMLKTLLGENHRDFSTGEQQDAAEYARFLLEKLHRAFIQLSSPNAPDVTKYFDFNFEERLECLQTGQVRYKTAPNNILQLNVPYQPPSHQIVNENTVRDVVSFDSCIRATLNVPEIVDDFMSPATGKKGQASRLVRLATYPKLLLIQLRRFVLAPTGWEGIKLECSIPAPLSIDLGSEFRGKGQQPGEVSMPDKPNQPDFAFNEGVIDTVMGMGFSREGAMRAAQATNNNAEAAVNWAMDHCGDADFNTPFPSRIANQAKSETAFVPSEEGIAAICGMGFSRNGAIKALKETGNNIEAAVGWALEHSGDSDFDTTLPEPKTEDASTTAEVDEEAVAILMSMGFDAEVSKYALTKCDHNVERASDYVLSRSAGDLETEMNGYSSMKATQTTTQEMGEIQDNHSTKYHLKAVISHVGKSTMSGHYVTHVNQSAAGEKPRWVFFNDEKVVLAQDPPLDLGYLLLYERLD